jgi:hypothetical protein
MPNSRRRQSPWQTVRDVAITFRRRMGQFEREQESEGEDIGWDRYYSDTFRVEGDAAEAVALAEIFLCKPETADMTEHVLTKYFLAGAIQPCTLNQRVNVMDADGNVTAETRWERVPAVQFYRVVEDPATIVKKQLLRDSQNIDVHRHGPNAVSISVVFRMDTDEDKVNFCRSLMGNRLVDFMRPHAYVHWTSLTRVIERGVVAENQPDSSDDDYEDVDVTFHEPTSPNYVPTSPVYRPMGTPSPPGSPSLSANPVAGTTTDGAKALQHVSDALFDLKETMPDDTYRRLSASLKRSYDEMLDANGNDNSIGNASSQIGVELVDDQSSA